MNAAQFVAAPGERVTDELFDQRCDGCGEGEGDCVCANGSPEAVEVMARELASASLDLQIARAQLQEADDFARRVLGCESIEEAKAEARAWLGTEAPF